MADERTSCLADESGTTLSELLVVMLLLGVVGAITTTGIVQGFNTQLNASNVAETLDGTRIATQRVRDFARGADEVCANSTDESLVLWTDDNANGELDDGELDIFELITDADGNDLFQRRVPLATTDDRVQLIRDDIINDALFTYEQGLVDPDDQPADLVCKQGTSVSNGPTRVRTVQVTFTVENPNPADPNLTTSTLVQLRNAGLQVPTGTGPLVDFTFTCAVGTEECSFDATASDPDGVVVGYEWDFDDEASGAANSSTDEDPTHVFSVGDVDYDVRLTVTDDDGLKTSITKTVRPGTSTGNAQPIADFTFSCINTQCSFDASASTDTDGTIEDYAWDFGDGTGTSGTSKTASRTYVSEGTYTVKLTVTDDDLATDSTEATVSATNNTMRVEGLTASGTGVSNNQWAASFTVELSLTGGGGSLDGVNISGRVTGGNGANAIDRTSSCSTDGTNRCTITFSSIFKQTEPITFTVTQVNDPGGDYVYDLDQNKASSISVSPGQTNVTAP